jgi:hypothetical protein
VEEFGSVYEVSWNTALIYTQGNLIKFDLEQGDERAKQGHITHGGTGAAAYKELLDYLIQENLRA